MNRSDTIKELASALCKFQSVMENVTKDSNNPFFKSKYADLASCWDAIKEPLTKNGLSIVQPLGGDEKGDYVETILLHTSGEWISGRLYLKKNQNKDDMQTLGSAVTYARRYCLSAIVGLCPEDDDGNAASQPQKNASTPQNNEQKISSDQAMELKKLLSKCPQDIVNGLLASLRAAPVFANSVDAIPLSKYESVVTYIKSKIEPEARTHE